MAIKAVLGAIGLGLAAAGTATQFVQTQDAAGEAKKQLEDEQRKANEELDIVAKAEERDEQLRQRETLKSLKATDPFGFKTPLGLPSPYQSTNKSFLG